MGRIKSYIARGIRYMLHGQPVNVVTASVYTLAPDQTLAGKKILVTGGGRGLGKAMAKKFIAEGAEVIITGRDEQTLADTASELGCRYITCDLTDINAVTSLIEKATSMLNGLNVLVNNAGVSLHEWELDKVTVEGYDQQFDTNLRAPYFLTQTFINGLTKRQDKGSILFVSSERSQTADIIPYGLTKAALNSFVHGLAKKYARAGIRINAVAPGVTASDMTGIDEKSNLYFPSNTNDRAYLPQEVAGVASFLISDASACLSGQILVCNEAKTVNAYF